MKHLLYISFLFLSLAAAAQPRYAILKVPQCWTTPTAVDSSVTRHVLIGTQYAAPITLFFTNANEDTVTVSGGSLAFGYCDCCGDGSPGGNNIIAINGLTQTGDTVTFGGVLIYDTQLDLGMYDLEVINGDTAVITGNWVGIVGGDGLKLNSVFFPRNDGFDGQSLVYDAAGDSLKWETITSDNIYNADGRQTDQLRTDTLGGKTLVFDGKTGLSDTSTMIILQADGSSDDAKTTFLRMDTEVLSFRDSLIFYDYDLSFIQRSSSNLEILSDGFTSVGGLNDSLRFQVGFLGPSHGAFFVDTRVTPRGIEYQSQAYRNTFSDSSLVDKGYVTSIIASIGFGGFTTNRIPVATSGTALGNSILLQGANGVTYDANKQVYFTGTPTLSLPASVAGGFGYNPTTDRHYMERSTGRVNVAEELWQRIGGNIYYGGSNNNVILNNSTALGSHILQIKAQSLGDTTEAFAIYNSSLQKILTISDNGRIRWGATGASAQIINNSTNNIEFRIGSGVGVNKFIVGNSIVHTFSGVPFSVATSGTSTLSRVSLRVEGGIHSTGTYTDAGASGGSQHQAFTDSRSWQSSAGAGGYDSFVSNPTINQTIGSNGAIRGFYANPVITATTGIGYRAFEFSNDTGKGLWGTGLAENYLQGNTGLGVSAPTQKLHVVGNARITGAYYDSNNDPGAAGQYLQSTATGTDWKSEYTGFNYYDADPDTLSPVQGQIFELDATGTVSGWTQQLKSTNMCTGCAITLIIKTLTGGKDITIDSPSGDFLVDTTNTASATGSLGFSGSATVRRRVIWTGTHWLFVQL